MNKIAEKNEIVYILTDVRVLNFNIIKNIKNKKIR